MGVFSFIVDLGLEKPLKGFNLDPDTVSYIMVLLSILVPFFGGLVQIFIASLVIFLDGVDGHMARKIGKNDELIDDACDRVSEIAMFIRSPFLLSLTIVNSLLAGLNKSYKKWYVRPFILRIFFVLYLLISL